MAINKRIYIDGMANAPVMVLGSGGAAAGADNTVSHMQLGPYCMELRHEQALDADDSICMPRVVDDTDCTNGLQVSIDTDDNQGVEMGFGILADANQPHAFKVGTDPAFFFEVKMGIPDVSDFDICAMGFRTAGAYVDAIQQPSELLAAYSDATNHKFLINIESGDVHVQKTTNGADQEDDVAATDVDDDDIVTLKVTVSSAGAVAAYVDGTAQTLTNAGTAFDSDDILVPFLFFRRNGAGGLDTPIIEYIACGYQ